MTEESPKIVFATIAAGGGHVATARAMVEAIDHHDPGRFVTVVSDYMHELGESDPGVATMDRRHKVLWRRMLRWPWLARTGQIAIDSLPRLTVGVQRRSLRSFARAAGRDPLARSADLIVSTHGLLSAGFALAKREFGLTAPLVTYATEPFRISAYWADPGSDLILVPTENALQRLHGMGVPKDLLECVGYPVGQAFLHPPTKRLARERLGLRDRFTVALSFGGEGVSPDAERLIRELSAESPEWQFVALCGRNVNLRSKMERGRPDNVLIVGFTDQMAAYVAASDVVVGKAGPTSVFEALAVGRPVLATTYAGLNERGVVDLLERMGVGGLVAEGRDLHARLRRFADAPSELESVARRCRTLDLERQTESVARRIARIALRRP